MLLHFTVFPLTVLAGIDTDGDGLIDEEETNKYFTDPYNADSDGDGYQDKMEILNNYSPRFKVKKLIEVDSDNDGLNDFLELKFGSNLLNKDSDQDGYTDKQEIDAGYDPISLDQGKLAKRIEINIAKQRLAYFLKEVKLGEFVVSTGVGNTTPKGEFVIGKKSLRAWSGMAGLWMPYWMPFYKGTYGIHELPEWPNGKKEGLDHLGQPVSHGCIRLGPADAKFLYDWTPEKTKVIIN